MLMLERSFTVRSSGMLAGCFLILTITGTGSPTVADEVHFEKQIRPLFQQHCGSCHGPKVQKSGLRMDAKSFAFKGGDSGVAIVAGKPEESDVVRRITTTDPNLKMPPQGAGVSAADADLIIRWIEQGAEWPETDFDRAALKDPRLSHWAWQAVISPTVPSIPESAAADRPRLSEIDRFVVSKLSDKGLQLSPEADRRALIRRLSFDLLGLPPSPEQVQSFADDTAPDAWEKLVDMMLESPHYGERWARHWLDVAHYADTHGFERDQRRDNAWRYRDWVIRALNADLPYDQFLKDQLAGDVLRSDDSAAVAATGFLAAGPWDFVGQAETPSPVLKRIARADDLDDMITQVMTSACAVTINCARCHDHKLDPISQREYYSVAAVFAGVKRGERVLSVKEQKNLADTRASLEQQLTTARSELGKLRLDGWSLADLVGGGDGHGTGNADQGIDPISGKSISNKRGFLDIALPNKFAISAAKYVDGVVIPDGGVGDVVISSTGFIARDVPDTSGKAWDAIRNGPVNSQFSTTLGGIDFTTDAHSLLSLHANSAITFDLAEFRASGLPENAQFRSQVGYFGQTPRLGASFHVLLDGERVIERLGIGRDDGLIDVVIPIPATARFLTLMATDNGNDISHDQICFVNAQLEPFGKEPSDLEATRIAELTRRVAELQQQISAVPEPARIYAAVAEIPPSMHVHLRGNPEQPGEEVYPGAISSVSSLKADFGNSALSDAERRVAFAEWITSSDNPLTRRVLVNRLWHHHFGAGIVDTPSDFGIGGSQPSHPELLDWLAERFLRTGWSIKAMNRLICLSAAYRQTSRPKVSDLVHQAGRIDSANRLLWRQNPRRLDAESLRDAVLMVSGKLNTEMFGPGYRDFEYKEEYAPVYTYITADKPDLWRRSVYRFIVRTTPDQFMATLDCPDAANLTPARNVTTTSLQALALMNNDFMLRQSKYLAERVASEAGAEKNTQIQIQTAFRIALARLPSQHESDAASQLLKKWDLTELCRALLNSNEFVYID